MSRALFDREVDEERVVAGERQLVRENAASLSK